MKLVFSKNEALEISVYKLSGNDKVNFNYIDMIKELIKTRAIETSELVGEFSEAEKESIDSMIEHINTEVANFYADDETGET